MAASNLQSWRGELRFDEPMTKHTSWRAGGIAKQFFQPADLDDLCGFLAALDPAEPLLWLGLGSNLLVRDGGFNGTVIFTLGALVELDWPASDRLMVGAGVTCAKVARRAAQAGMTGVEFLAGIPGTLGGALAMNAGAFGGETWSHVVSVVTVDRSGQLRTRTPDEYGIGYRHVHGLAGEWFVTATLQLTPGDTEKSQQAIRDLLIQRGETQPTQQYSCGSVFKNPVGDYAARLIEASGLKGMTRGGAEVSQKHANFIINTGQATAADIEGLINQVQADVEQQHGVRLETEVRIVGEPLS